MTLLFSFQSGGSGGSGGGGVGVNVNEIIKIIVEYHAYHLNFPCLSFRFFVRLKLQPKRPVRTNYIKM